MRLRTLCCFAALAVCTAPLAARADTPQLVSPDSSSFRINGSVEMQLRGLADGFEADRAYLSQWAWILNLEPEWDIAPDGWGPFDSITAFARLEARYGCIWTGCSIVPTWRHFGDRATRTPARNWADGVTEQYAGGIDLTEQGIRRRPVHGGSKKLLDITHLPRFERAYAIGISPETVSEAFGPLADDLFTYKSIDGPRESLAVPLGPWNPDSKIRSNGSRAFTESPVLGLPLRPKSNSLYIPSERLRRKRDSFGSFDQNFRQTELEWNHGGSQDEWELRELYVDLELFESKLWIRAGKQNIVWGKTELFRTTDQFNPVDIGLASLPSFEESRIPLWSVRGVWSFYEVGPFEDVRLEVAFNFDDFEPIDTGRCGEPYTVWIICLKSTGLWAHGVTGTGIAGEQKPPNPWDSWHGLEFGARLEWRWGAFSFALMDFYGFDDIPAIELFNTYERRVDPKTGKPLDSLGRPLRPETALEYSSGNRQAFDFGCLASQGFGENALFALTGGSGTIPDVSERCIGDIVNVRDPLTLDAELNGLALSISAEPTNALGAILAGQLGGNLLIAGAIEGLEAALMGVLDGTLEQRLVALNRDVNDGPAGGGIFGADCPTEGLIAVLCPIVETSNVSWYLTAQQEALLGCGAFYGTDCDVDGIDVFNSEASVLLQAFPGFEYNPVGTRFENGKTYILPGGRGPGDTGYDVREDGTPPDGFRSEMEALSSNFATGIAVLGIAEGDTGCVLERLETCAAIQAVVSLTGSQRPEIRAGGNGRFGRRDFAWHGGGEALIRYPKRNVLGFSFDVAEDRTKSSWGVEFTWVAKDTYGSNTSQTLLQETDTYNLTVSVDRPTFVNFLNANRTFFLNAQVFFRYIPHYDQSFDTNGPLSVLATFAITTGYFQDRLLPAIVFVHDFSSSSGGVVGQITYRFNEAFSVTAGLLAFYGGPEKNPIARYPISLFDTQTSFDARLRYAGLSAIAERDEAFLKLRYTF